MVTQQHASKSRLPAGDIAQAQEPEIDDSIYRAIFQEMREGAAVFRLIYNAAEEPVDYVIEECNFAFAALYGTTRNAIVGQLAGKASSTGQPPHLNDIAQVDITGKPLQLESYEPQRGIHVKFTGFSLGNRRVVVMAEDIRAAKQLEQQLWEMKERYQGLYNSAQVGLFMTRIADGKPLECNDFCARLFGYQIREELLAIPTVSDLYTDPRKRQEMLNRLSQDGTLADYEATFIRKDGKTFIGRLTARFAPETDCIIGSLVDVTSEKLTKRALQESERLLRVSSAKLLCALQGTVSALSTTTEWRDAYTAGHQQRVARLACAIARAMGLPEYQVQGIQVAGLLHDIGKIGVPLEILCRPGKLTSDEFAIIKTHPQVGYEILRSVDFPWPIAEMVLQHHWRNDGSGYPEHLQGNNILLAAKILAVADVVEAISSYRPYRPALGIDRALEEIERGADRLYDAEVVAACLRVFHEEQFQFSDAPGAQKSQTGK